MPRESVKAGATSITDTIFVRDTSVTTKISGLTALAFNTASMTLYYRRDGSSADVQVTLVTATLGTWTSGGFVKLDDTNMPGQVEIGYPNAAVAAGAKYVTFTLRGATNMEDISWSVELTAVDTQSANAFITGVNSLGPPVGWNLPTFTGTPTIAGTGTLTITGATATQAGTLPITTTQMLLSAGTGTGQLDFTSGIVKANLWQILGTVLTETAGQIAAAFKKFFDIASPTSTANRITLVDTVTANTDMRGTDNAALAATALSTAVWTNAKAGFLTGDAFVRIGANGAGLTSVTLADASLTTAKLGTFVLAKTTNITGFNDIAAGAAMTLTGAYDAAKTAAQANSDFSSATFPAMALATSQPNYAPAKAGDKMDLVNAPNATAITAIQSGLATASNLATLAGKFTGITSIGNWLRAAMRKTAPDITALGEINAVTNSLAGTYDATADSTQAIAEGGGTSGATVGQIQAAFGPGPYGPIDDEATFIDDMATRLLSDPTKKIQVTDSGVVVDGGNVDTVNNPVQTVGASGDGTQPVNQTTIATDAQNMLVEVNGSPAGGVVIKAYRAADWDTVPRPAPLSVKGQTVSLDDGTWENALLLTSSITYVINFEMPDVSVQRRVIVP